jgi:RNA polymerase-binding transcription factor DksA
MVQDITARRDFTAKRNLWWFEPMALFNQLYDDELTPPYEEVVLTGTALERSEKKYILDSERGIRNVCECCGLPIRIKPWDFYNMATLCQKCNKLLEEETQDIKKGIRYVKPWEIFYERENPIDNVLLWD